MKKLLNPVLFGCLVFTLYNSSVKAQDLAIAYDPLRSNAAYLNSIISSNIATTAIPLASVNAKVNRLFTKEHTDAQNVKWYNNSAGYLAEFDWAGVKSRALYGKRGYWYYDVRFGSEKDLPKAARKLLKANYVDYSIGRAVEVNLGGDKHAWVVNLQDADNLVVARIIDNSLDELAHYDTHAPVKTRKARIVIPQ